MLDDCCELRGASKPYTASCRREGHAGSVASGAMGGNGLVRLVMAGLVVACMPTQMAHAASITGVVTVLDAAGKATKPVHPVVVFLDEVENVAPPQPMKTRPRILQAGKAFTPSVVPITVGTTVDFPNDDSIFHNVFSLSRAKPFDLGIFEQGAIRSVRFDDTGLVNVYCNIHPQMIAYILVLGNPHFALTDVDGRFEIHDVPEGKATVRTWYSRTRKHPETAVKVTSAGIEGLDLSMVENVKFEIREENISVKHSNKWGADYPAKY